MRDGAVASTHHADSTCTRCERVRSCLHSTQYKTVLDALRGRKERFMFEDVEIGLRGSVMAFITMNPGYPGRAGACRCGWACACMGVCMDGAASRAGARVGSRLPPLLCVRSCPPAAPRPLNPPTRQHTELPESLKALFRPVAMVVPDLGLICEIMLMAEGFQVRAPVCVPCARLGVVLRSTHDSGCVGLTAPRARAAPPLKPRHPRHRPPTLPPDEQDPEPQVCHPVQAVRGPAVQE
jgi:hypothetical protein